MELWVPGRIEFLGKHTDYAGGRSLLCPVERGIRATVRPRADSIVRVHDSRLDATVGCILDPEIDLSLARGRWAIYVETVARRLARDFPKVATGVDISFESDLPVAAGLSSSSALVVMLYMAIAAANDLESDPTYRENIQSPEDLAEYVGSIENGAPFRAFAGDTGVGTLNGCEDQTAMICGRADSLVRYSFRPVRFEDTSPIPRDLTFAVAASGVAAEKTASAMEKHNLLSRRASAAAQCWRQASGRSDPTLADALAYADVETVRDALLRTPVAGFTRHELVDRLEQFHLESETIIPAAAEALHSSDLASLGVLVDRSQVGVERLLGNQIPETIALARLARHLGAVAASAFGAGFGGSVWALVQRTDADGFVESWRREYASRFPQHRETSTFFVTRAGPPATLTA